MFEDDDGEQRSAGEGDDGLVPKTRDLAAEITPTISVEEDEDEDLLEGELLERRDEAAEVAVDDETALAFWAAVVYVNVGVLLVSLGPMLAVFRGRVQVGAVLVVLGSLALYRAYTVYRDYTEPADAEVAPETPGDYEESEDDAGTDDED